MVASIPIIKKPRRFPPGCGPNAPKTGAAFHWYRQLQPSHKSPVKAPTSGRIEHGCSNISHREKIKSICKLFGERCSEIRRSDADVQRVDLKAWKEFKQNRKILGLTMSNSTLIGSVPGVEIGDRFEYRVELLIVGVHGRLQHGIDYSELHARRVATCVIWKVDHDKMIDSDLLAYKGEGSKKTNQVMTFGNLALYNSMKVKNEVRVVRGVKDKRSHNVVYVYDGLYQVVECKNTKGPEGNVVFQFYMKRKIGQPMVNWNHYTLV